MENTSISQQPLVLNLAPTGMVPTRSMSPHVPLTAVEIVADVLQAAEQGITVAHLHARDDDGRPTTDPKVYARIIAGIREHRSDIVLCVSCSGRDVSCVKRRSAALELRGDLKPDMASLTLSSLNFPRQASVNSPDTVRELALRMQDRGILPELEVFDLGMANMICYLQQRDLLPAKCYANVLFGNLASAQASLLDVAAVTTQLPPETTWSLAGLGAAQLPMATLGVAMAHGVRIGLEDNLWLDADRRELASNFELVRRVHQISAAMGRPIMTSVEFRRRLLTLGNLSTTASPVSLKQAV